ncbi:hypothetical protein E3N88_33221 [Mikania micrantha]|uniref:Uncharacterized protein n=1 Tax=Mikania micrantha TaxID=192012 RepID=A0A5N6MC00_9ASTR|nr:hypothetical protein E3N88_33221 [Mikania micrantha]
MSAGEAPSFSDTWNPGSYTTSSSSTTNAPTRPVSFQRLIDQKPPSIQDVDPRAKNSNIETLKDEVNSPPSFGDVITDELIYYSTSEETGKQHSEEMYRKEFDSSIKQSPKNWIEKNLIPAINNLHFHQQLNKEIMTRDDNEEVDKDDICFEIFIMKVHLECLFQSDYRM